MPECAVCGGGEFDLSDGLFFCSECGTQSQDVREEVTAEDNTLFVRTLFTAKKEKLGKAADYAGPSSLEKFQLVLQKQSDALISLGFLPTVKEAVKLIWFQYLKHYGYAFNEVGDDNDCKEENTTTPKGRKRNAGGTPRAKRAKVDTVEPNLFDVYPEDDHLFRSDSDTDIDTEWQDSIETSGPASHSGEELYMQRRSDMLCRQNVPVYFTLKHTIALCYLALLYTKQNVMLSDLSRWIKTNKVPYHNLPDVLPRAMMVGRGCLSLVAVFPMTADNIQTCVRHLYRHLPLPPLPPPSAEFVCHTLLDRLQLPACLHRLVDRVLATVHTPRSLMTGTCKYWRFDGECLAVIILLLKLLYKLDDKFEIEQPSAAAGQVVTGNSVYVWTDWVQLYCQHLQDSMKDGIPLTESEFVRVKDWQKYLDFCRVGIFGNTRPTPLDAKRRYFYNPELYADISGIFKQHCSKSQHRDQQKHSSGRSSELKDKTPAGHTFIPRLVPLNSLISGPRAPCKDYEMLPCSPKQVHLTDIQLSRSMWFLLKVGSELIDIAVEELYSSLVMVETSLQERTLLPLQRILKLQHP